MVYLGDFQKFRGVPTSKSPLGGKLELRPINSFRHQMTTKTETTLLTHLLALCLKVDNYATDTTVIAQDLSRSTSE